MDEMKHWAFLRQVAELGVPYILMHMRGDPGTMQRAEHTSYGNICADVGRELQAAADAAGSAGIEPWRLVLDPGELLPLSRSFLAAMYACHHWF